MKELKNNVSITGDLVKINFEEFRSKKGQELYGGSVILRTADNSEHEVRFVTPKYKKDENGNSTGELSFFYNQYVDAIDTLKDMEHCLPGESPDVVRITDGYFTDNDFKSQTGQVVSNNVINARFINRVEPKDYDITIKQATFEVQGIVEKIEDEFKSDTATGNKLIKFVAFSQIQKDFKDSNSYDIDRLIPIKLTLSKEMVNDFINAGYYDGVFTKFYGQVVNTTNREEIEEKVAFGQPQKKVITTYDRKNLIKSGTSISQMYEHEITDEMLNALREKRKQKLAMLTNDNIPSGFTSANSQASNGYTPDKTTPPMVNNPFAIN